MEKECVFCKIVKGEIPCHKIYEDERYLAFLDANPAGKGHTLLIPKQHYGLITEAPPDEVGSLFRLAVEIAKGINRALDYNSFNIFQNNGRPAGQIIDHVHVHILPRQEGDETIKYMKPALNLNESEFKEIAEKIREEMK